MTAVTEISLGRGPSRRTSIQRWRRRSRVIAALRILLPVLIGVILVGLGASVAYNAFTTQRTSSGKRSDPIRLVTPHFVGRDAHGRPYVLTSVTATRDPNNPQRVFLDKPILVLDAKGTDPLHITGGAGIYHEDTGILEVSQGVRLSDARGTFDTTQSVFNTKTEDVEGSHPIQGLGSLGNIQAKSYAVYDKGARVVFNGNVHTRLQPK